tara:strand:- start:346 stop:918 length:573 start_codon:yes stop_codon:yes gene_type:complete
LVNETKTKKKEKRYNSNNVLFMSSKSKQFQLVRRLDAKLQALSTEIQDLSPYEREQTGLCRWVPKKSIFDDSGGNGDGGTRQRPQSAGAQRKRKKKTTGKKKTSKMTRVRNNSRFDLSNTLHRRKNAIQKGKDQKRKNYMKRHRQKTKKNRSFNITSAGLSKCKQLRRLFIKHVKTIVSADRAAFWVYVQ